MKANQVGPGLGVLVFAPDRQGIVPLGAQAVVIPALLAKVAGQVVIVAAQVHGPALAESIQYKGSQIQVTVVGLVVTPLETDEQGILVVPGGAEERDIDAPVKPFQRLSRLRGRSRQSRGPEEMKDRRAIAHQAQLMLRVFGA